MGATGVIHHIGTFFLFVATVLLIITDITAPVVHNLSILEVVLGNTNVSNDNDHAKINFGVFGYCTTGLSNGTYCSPNSVGYSPADVMKQVEGTQFSSYAHDTTSSLTRALVLHPVATGLSGLAFILALGAGVVGSLMAALVSLLAFVVTAVILIIDFVLFSIIRSNVNDDSSNSYAQYQAGIWLVLVAAICLLLGAAVVFLSCCSGRMHRRREAAKVNNDYGAPRRRRFW